MTTRFLPFQPPERILLGPGPSNVHPRVLDAMARPVIGHLDSAFSGLMEELKALLRYAFRTENSVTFPLSGPGSAGMEACVVNLVEPGEPVAVCINGVFGQRLSETILRCGGRPVPLEFEWGLPVTPDRLAELLKSRKDISLVAVVHAETSTGVRSDVAALADTARQHGCLILVDAVTSLGGIPLLVDEWQLDAVYSASQKCLSCTPGLSPLTFSERALDKIRHRKNPVQSWFLDVAQVLGYWGTGKRSYHHTAPISPLYGLHEALLMLHEEGLQTVWQRHRLQHQALAAGLRTLGLSLPVAEPWRLPQLNTVEIPPGVEDEQTRAALLNRHGLEIGAGLGAMAGKVWRIGLMGNSARQDHVVRCLAALGAELELTEDQTRLAMRHAAAAYPSPTTGGGCHVRAGDPPGDTAATG